MGEPVIRREPSLNAVSGDSRLQALLLWHEIDAFNARYAAALDEQRLSEWTEMFTDDALYVILSRENFDSLGKIVRYVAAHKDYKGHA